MIDEKTTQISKPAKASRDLKSSLRKRAPIESLSTSTGIASSFSSQEPRRPRFSFFLSSQCQRADPNLTRGKRRVEASLPNLKNRSSPPVARQPPCPVRKHQTVGVKNLTQRRQRHRDIGNSRMSVNPNFSIFFNSSANQTTENFEPRLLQISLLLQRFAAVRFAVWRLALQR